MAREVHSFAVTLTAGTTAAAAVTTDVAMPPREIRKITAVIPNGCAGLVGFRLTIAGISVLPVQGTDWIIGNGETIDWVTDGYPNSGAWQLTGYNTDVFDHTIYLRFEVDPPNPVPTQSVTVGSTVPTMTSAPSPGV